MTTVSASTYEYLPEYLARSFTTSHQQGVTRWALQAQPGHSRASAQIEDNWLHLSIPITLPCATPESVLRWNAGLPGGIKLCRQADGGGELCADVALDMDVDQDQDAALGIHHALLPLRIEQVSANIARILQDITSGAAPGQLPEASPADGLLDLCRETGWPSQMRGSDRVAVTLDVPRQFAQALVAAHADGEVQATLLLIDAMSLSPVCRQAVTLLLNNVNGSLRFARSFMTGDGAITAGITTVLNKDPVPAELAHAFNALSLAARLCAREIKICADNESLARRYLQIRGIIPEEDGAENSTPAVSADTNAHSGRKD